MTIVVDKGAPRGPPKFTGDMNKLVNQPHEHSEEMGDGSALHLVFGIALVRAGPNEPSALAEPIAPTMPYPAFYLKVNGVFMEEEVRAAALGNKIVAAGDLKTT